MPTPKTPPLCHPYARISDPDQRKGGGLERQTKADVETFCSRFGLTLAKRIRVDDGVSAFKGLNATPDHELGKFLLEGQKGLIRSGDCLLLENWDRLSRQNIWAAIGLVNDLRQLGIHVGRLDRMKLLRCDSADPGDFFEAAVELMRGHSESAAKSMRNSAAWEQKRSAARAGDNQRPRKKDGRVTKAITGRLPAWVEEHDGELHLIPSATAALRRVFALAAAGYGQLHIVKKLIAEGVKPFGHRAAGRTGPRKGSPERWSMGYLAKLLKDRRVLGELQPRKGDRTKAGDVIPDYYPRALSDDEFNAARAGCAQRKVSRGRLGKHVNVFSGLLTCASDGESYFCTASFGSRQRGGRGSWVRVLKNTASLQGRSKCRTFPFASFESAVLSALAELDPHEILNGDEGPDESLALSRELDGVTAELADAAAFMDESGFSPTIGRRITALEARKADLAARLAEAREKAAHPLSETWGQTQSLLAIIASAPDPADVRLRLRTALRRIVDAIWLLVVPRGADRLCAVQIWFADRKRCRSYVVFHQAARGNQSARREGCWRYLSLASVIKVGDLDLRRRDHAARLEKVLTTLDLSELE
jgi:DNA invertase Pin-like site-specific DNA recombinase